MIAIYMPSALQVCREVCRGPTGRDGKTQACNTGYLRPHLHLKDGFQWSRRAKFYRCRRTAYTPGGTSDWEEVRPCIHCTRLLLAHVPPALLSSVMLQTHWMAVDRCWDRSSSMGHARGYWPTGSKILRQPTMKTRSAALPCFSSCSTLLPVQEWAFREKGLLGASICRLHLGNSQNVHVPAGRNAAAVLALAGALSLQAMQLGLAKAGYLSKAFSQVCRLASSSHSFHPIMAPYAVPILCRQGDCCQFSNLYRFSASLHVCKQLA